ncbi:MAG: hypothetical protein ACLGJC_28255 [Alphaproteobacteria bacterium]
MPAMNFRFSVLVIEDTPLWSKQMGTALSETLGRQNNRFRWGFANSSQETLKKLSQSRYHFLSIDQNIPVLKEDAVSPDVGLGLNKILSNMNYSGLRAIYTAHGELHWANKAGQDGSCPYLVKSTSGENHPEKNIFTVYGWAEWIGAALEERYLPSTLKLAGARLPFRMGERARLAEDHLASQNSKEYLAQVCRLWECALNLAWAQTAALCLTSGIPIGRFPDDKPVHWQESLGDLWPRLAERGWLAPWRRYVGKGSPDNGSGAGERFLVNGSEPLRQIRNMLAHSEKGEALALTDGSVDRLVHQARDPLLFLMDALAHWVEHPFLLAPVRHPHVEAALVGRALAGSSRPFAEMVVEMPKMRALPQTIGHPSTRNHLYLPWSLADGSSQLVPLYPFIQIDRHPTTGVDDLVVMVGRSARGGALWRSLTDMQVRTDPARDAAARDALNLLFGGRR